MSYPNYPAFPCESRLADSGGGRNPQMYSGVSILDYFAVRASEEDMQAVKARVPLVDRVHIGANGSKSVYRDLPANWRQIARYLCAKDMLEARGQFIK